jgi:hypothetical protein
VSVIPLKSKSQVPFVVGMLLVLTCCGGSKGIHFFQSDQSHNSHQPLDWLSERSDS